MNKIYQKAIVLVLTPELFLGLGKGVEVIPIPKSLALKLLQRVDNYNIIFTGELLPECVAAELLKIEINSGTFTLVSKPASFLSTKFDETHCPEMLYMYHDQYFLITPL